MGLPVGQFICVGEGVLKTYLPADIAYSHRLPLICEQMFLVSGSELVIAT
ncbi:MAG: hypothetical protein VX430_03340 [Pseudomonadota bacterium]|nr:hypothetical protein [Pseudomonadota bacterium]